MRVGSSRFLKRLIDELSVDTRAAQLLQVMGRQFFTQGAQMHVLGGDAKIDVLLQPQDPNRITGIAEGSRSIKPQHLLLLRHACHLACGSLHAPIWDGVLQTFP